MEKGLRKEDSAALKGVAVLMLVFHHCYRKVDLFEKYDVVFRGISSENVIFIASFCKICVGIFAFVSGYGLMYGYELKVNEKKTIAIKNWVLRHFVSTLSGFWFTAIVFYIIYFLRQGNFQNWGNNFFEKFFAIIVDVLGISQIFGTKSLNGSWWYMGAAVVFILMVPILADCMERYGSFVCIILTFLFPRLMQIGFPGGTSIWSFFMIFVVGMICCRHHFFENFHVWMRGKKKFILTIMMLIATIFLYEKFNKEVFWEFQYAWAPFIVIIFCVEYLFRWNFALNVLGYLGKHSMHIWLVHTFIRNWYGKYVFSVKEFYLIPLVIIVISVAISYFLIFLRRVSGYDHMVYRILKSKKL